MTTNTESILSTVLGTDSSVSPEQMQRVLSILKGEEATTTGQASIGRVLSRKEVASILGCSAQAVDYYCRKGWLHKVKFGQQSRASGITEEALREFINRNQNTDRNSEVKL